MSELHGPEELYVVVRGNHSNSLESISVKQAVGLVKTEECNLCKG